MFSPEPRASRESNADNLIRARASISQQPELQIQQRQEQRHPSRLPPLYYFSFGVLVTSFRFSFFLPNNLHGVLSCTVLDPSVGQSHIVTVPFWNCQPYFLPFAVSQ